MARRLYAVPVLFDRKALILPGDGTYRLVPYEQPGDEQIFLSALRIVRWRIAHHGCL
jgi:hypothetical protein